MQEHQLQQGLPTVEQPNEIQRTATAQKTASKSSHTVFASSSSWDNPEAIVAKKPRKSNKQLNPKKTDDSAQQLKEKKDKGYIPAFESGGYAILLALYMFAGPCAHMSKNQIQVDAQQFCSSSFTVPKDTGSGKAFYTAWNSMAMLLKKELVFKSGTSKFKKGTPARYSLSDTGKELARKMKKLKQDGIELHSSSSEETDTKEYSLKTKQHQSGSIDQPDLNFNNKSDTFKSLNLLAEFNSKEKLKRTHDPSREWRHGALSTTRSRESSPHQKPKSSKHNHNPSVILQKGTYEICLVLDNREVRTQKDRTRLII